MPSTTQQLTLPDLDDFTGLTATEYLRRLINLVTQCASMEPERYLRELDRLSKMREAGRITDSQKQGFHALEGLTEVVGMQREREHGTDN